jgi:hypothetical protein
MSEMKGYSLHIDSQLQRVCIEDIDGNVIVTAEFPVKVENPTSSKPIMSVPENRDFWHNLYDLVVYAQHGNSDPAFRDVYEKRAAARNSHYEEIKNETNEH